MHTIPRLLISGALFAASACSQSTPATTSDTVPAETRSTSPTAPDSAYAQSTATPKSTVATATPTPKPTEGSQAHIDAAARALRNGNFQAAIEAYSAALDSTADDDVAHSDAHLGLASSYLRGGEIWEAAETLEEFIINHHNARNSADARFMLGYAHLTLGNNDTAIQHFNTYITENPAVIDSYVLELIGDAHRALAEYAAAADDYQAAILADRGGNINFLLLDKAESLQATGDIDGAISLFDLVDNNTNYEATRARMDYERAQAHTAGGDYASAINYYTHAITTYPDSYYAYLSLVDLLSYGGEVDEFQRGLVDYHANKHTPAVLAFRRYLTATPNHDARVHYYMALSYRALDEIPAAEAHLLEIVRTHPADPLWAEAAIELAYTQWGWGENYSGALATLLNVVEMDPGNSSTPQAIFDAGRVAERSTDLQLAATLWGRLADEYPSSNLAPRAAFLSGISLYRLGEFSDSISRFSQSGSFSNNDIDETTAALLWTGKAHAENGDENLAVEAWETAAITDPGGYYGLRARELVAGKLAFTRKPNIDFASSRSLAAKNEAEAWLAIRLGIPQHDLGKLSPQLEAEGRWLRGSTLWRLGLFEDARDELDSLRNSYQTDALASYQLALAFRDLGYYYGAIWAGRHCMDALGLTNPFNAPEFITHLRYGTYYLDLIIPASAEYKIDPLLVYALIRQESLFQGQVTSSAYAHGLMQVIPPTGDYIARQLQWPGYHTTDLYLPYVNVAFGAFYLAEQRDIFDGNLYAALVAYNAGPGNTSIWQRLSGGDYDLLVEIIRLQQPRDYVRRIVEHYAVYRHLYAAN